MTEPSVPNGESAVDSVAAAHKRIEADGRPGIWIELIDREVALARAAEVDEAHQRGEIRPLRGVTVAVKGNFDVAGHRTTAGCPTFGDIAVQSAPCVAALEAAGAVIVGITSLDQFATGLDGTRSPLGPCPNAHWPELISGGSSSGSGVAVAAGLVDAALGTDTAGSGRVPAAANGIVGLKTTRSSVSRAGIVPACFSVDSVAVFAASVSLAAAVANAIRNEAPDPADPWSRAWAPATVPDRSLRVGVADVQSLDFDGDPLGAAEYRRAVEAIAAVGAELVTVDIEPFLAAGRLLYGGAFVAERYAAVGAFIAGHTSEVDPVVGKIIGASAGLAGWEVYRDLAQLEAIRQQTAPLWTAIDVLALPTVPRIPAAAEAQVDRVAPSVMLGRFTNFVNLLDLCALTIPIGQSTQSRPPASVSLIAQAAWDDVLVGLGVAVTSSTLGSVENRHE